MTTIASTQNQAPGRYYARLVALAASVALLLFTVVEMRRAFLFPLSDYLKIGAPSAILYLDLRHLPLLVVGILGVWLSYRYLARLESDLAGRGIDLSRLTRLLGVGLLVLFIVDLFIYRGVPASRTAAAGKIGVGRAIPTELFEGWLRPLGEGINSMALVWHAIVLGILIGALFLTLVVSLLKSWVGAVASGRIWLGPSWRWAIPSVPAAPRPLGPPSIEVGLPWGRPWPSSSPRPCST